MQQHSQIVYPNTFFVHNILKIGGKTILFLNFLNSRTILKQFQDKTKKVGFFKNNLSTKKFQNNSRNSRNSRTAGYPVSVKIVP